MSIQNPYDHALKILARAYPAEFLRLGFPGKSVRLLGAQANVELALEIDAKLFLGQQRVKPFGLRQDASRRGILPKS